MRDNSCVAFAACDIAAPDGRVSDVQRLLRELLEWREYAMTADYNSPIRAPTATLTQLQHVRVSEFLISHISLMILDYMHDLLHVHTSPPVPVGEVCSGRRIKTLGRLRPGSLRAAIVIAAAGRTVHRC